MLTANRSNIGRVRQVNEDQCWVGSLGGGIAIAVVADGMGGHQAGDVASQTAVDTFRGAFEQHADKQSLTEQEGKMLIRQAIAEANETIYAMASRNERYHNMGTTVVAALMLPGTAVIGHVGDSRAYRVGDGGIQLLTMDHSLVNELVKSGQLSAEEAAHHPRRNVLTRAIGTDPVVEIDVQSVDWSTDDVLLLCSDGLTNMVNEEQIVGVVADRSQELEAKADHLIQLALEGGGDDNITVVLLQEQPTGEARGASA
ncbi:Stp1/IreP family PP2C-type Ser/Thr phosphatase [Paenibacillus sp. LHD-117]|uniref:Stp1/IreP family PP2C-type Ser/Thr phosphatase n=1 Tax=Paenibacillus sp. LHD-117 TaxID=3071412 RepID=UPI0027E13DA7|nr:Stp1/IreP family PP2C-type Ser/Thr phosphatase [Paenibacillus sp. LHD-117]MDQ6420827.1 Stp1/IreP family PP2C-type Ser/Thr phosphatase [Paenibacillus sp. LHD-117]